MAKKADEAQAKSGAVLEMNRNELNQSIANIVRDLDEVRGAVEAELGARVGRGRLRPELGWAVGVGAAPGDAGPALTTGPELALVGERARLGLSARWMRGHPRPTVALTVAVPLGRRGDPGGVSLPT